MNTLRLLLPHREQATMGTRVALHCRKASLKIWNKHKQLASSILLQLRFSLYWLTSLTISWPLLTAVHSNARTPMVGQLKTFPLNHSLCEVRCAEPNSLPRPPPPQPPAEISDVTDGGLKSAPCCQMLVFCICISCFETSPAGSTGKEWNHTGKLNCNTMSCTKCLHLWRERFLTDSWSNFSHGEILPTVHALPIRGFHIR